MSGDTEFALIMAVEAVIGCCAIGVLIYVWPAIRAKAREERELKEQYRAERQRLKQAKLMARRHQGSATA
jgi:type II secretory pathway pseudopilin PulG